MQKFFLTWLLTVMLILAGFSMQAHAVTPQLKASGAASAKEGGANYSVDHFVLLKQDGTVWQWGEFIGFQCSQRIDSDSNWLVIYTPIGSNVPVQISGLADVTSIAAGQMYNIALLGDGTVAAWGPSNLDGLSLNYWYKRWRSGPNDPGPCADFPTITTWKITDPSDPTGFLNNITAIWADMYGSYFAKKNDGTILAWGNNLNDKLGVNAHAHSTTPPDSVLNISVPRAVRFDHLFPNTSVISSGFNHTLTLKGQPGDIIAWGGNNYGQRGDGTFIGAPWSGDEWTDWPRTSLLYDVIEVIAGHYQSVALKNDGTVWAWGWNQVGELGSSVQPISMAYATNGTNTPVQVPGIPGGVSAIAIGGYCDWGTSAYSCHSLAMLDNGTVYGWGSDCDDQLGVDWRSLPSASYGCRTAVPVQVSNLSNATAIATAGKCSAALRNDGSVWEWGDCPSATSVQAVSIINGPIAGATCGAATAQTFTAAPTRNLCLIGTPSAVTGSGPWTWTCTGVSDGTSVSCTGNIVPPAPVNGTCGAAYGKTFTTAPTTDLCSQGNASSVTGSGPWNWTCAGLNGGTTASCSANIQAPLTDVTSELTITRGGIRYNRTTGNFVQQVTLQNTGGAAIAAPLYLVLDELSANITLVNKTGNTVSTAPAGSPYIEIMNTGTLAAGNTVSVILYFKNPSNTAISYDTRVLAGAGMP